MKLKIEKNPVLFNRWKSLGMKIGCLNTIVQNDMELDSSDITDWKRQLIEATIELTDLKRDTLDYIRELNGLP